MTTSISAKPVEWRYLSVGACVWAPQGRYGWRPAVVVRLGKNRGANTICYLAFGSTWRYQPGDPAKGKGTRHAFELFWRNPNSPISDKPVPISKANAGA